MKKVCIFFMVGLFFLSFSIVLGADEENKLSLKPGITFDEFKAYWEQEGTTPEGAVKCLIIAVLETVKEGNKDGKKMWALLLPKDHVTSTGEPDSRHRNAINQFNRQIKGTNFKGAIAASYLGGTPGNGYSCAYSNDIDVDEGQSIYDDDGTKLFVRSGGKDIASPVLLKKNKDGYWKIFEYSSLYTGVKSIQTKDF
ncbi:MAG TPA: hypothetical protein PL110_07895 [Candidatus Eremiobacteraeota bacterium]|nr:MAG: hypothetical protein BWY64_02752 [bacterium ADurb.Bin363]HPZ08020.1 hypothetical protein [Candidatus Eremiobacteraeota bacterium]